MTVLALSEGRIVWNHSTVHGSGLLTAATQLMTAVGIGWGFSWAAWASDEMSASRCSMRTGASGAARPPRIASTSARRPRPALPVRSVILV